MDTIVHIPPGGDLTDAYSVRFEVFVQEQGFSVEIEVDDIDITAHHVVLYRDGKPFATARTFPEGGDGTFIIGRVAVRKCFRGGGTGKALMREIESLAASLGAKTLTLGAQLQAAEFYRKCGYHEYGEHYFEEHCEHVHMKKQL